MTRRTAPRAALPALLATGLLLTGCGTPPPPTPIPAAPGSPLPTVTALPTPSPLPTLVPAPAGTLPGLPGLPVGPPTAAPTAAPPPASPSPTRSGPPARDCAGKPGAQTVLALLRAPGGILGPDAAVTVTTGPLCADGWQFTVLSAPGNGFLQVITRGRPDALRVVTAGTDLCTPQVRAEAPPGIATLACNSATPDEPGA